MNRSVFALAVTLVLGIADVSQAQYGCRGIWAHDMDRFRGPGSFHALVARVNPADPDRRAASESESAARHREAARTAGCSSIRTNDATSFDDERRPRSVTRDAPSDSFELKTRVGPQGHSDFWNA